METARPAASESRPPAWLSDPSYRALSKVWVPTSGGRVHAVDDGRGPALLFVHGNGQWSFAFRRVIERLRPRFRCVAVDLLGFGLSDKPIDWSHAPADHARVLGEVIDGLGLRSFAVVANDWGVPIALSQAINRTPDVAGVVVTNGSMWAPRWRELDFAVASRLMGGRLGRWSIEHHHAFVRFVMRPLVLSASERSPQVWRHYLEPQASPPERTGMWAFLRHIRGSASWLEARWSRIGALASKPTLLVWGRRDPVFRSEALHRWQRVFPGARVCSLGEAGHYPHLDDPDAMAFAIDAWMRDVVQPRRGRSST